MSIALYTILSVLAVSVIALIAAIPLLAKKELPRGLLVILLSISVGTLLGAVALHYAPEIYSQHDAHVEHPEIHEEHLEIHEEHHNESEEHHNETIVHEEHEEEYGLATPLMLLAGFLIFFVLEKFIHHHHSHQEEETTGHSHAYHLAPINLAGDAIHNFIDGLVIAASYAASIPLGIAATVSVLFHELPQELADMGVLLYAGLSKTKALLYNFAAALTALLGGALGLLLAGTEHFVELILPFAAGVFIYIAASNLVPELHRDCGIKDTLIHVLAIIVGIGLMVALKIWLPHAH